MFILVLFQVALVSFKSLLFYCFTIQVFLIPLHCKFYHYIGVGQGPTMTGNNTVTKLQDDEDTT